ncbi:MAG: DMT family transporter [Clostridiales bacterium]|nr:DMT family transporter [Clostridiales bacterium]
MRSRLKTTLLPLLAAMIWGTAFAAQDVCADSMDAMTFNALRFFIAVIFLLAVGAALRAFRRRKASADGPSLPEKTPEEKKLERKRLLTAALTCGTALAAASVLQQAGMSLGTDAGKSGFITALYVVLVPIAGLFLKKRVPPVFWLAVALAVAGLYLLCMSGSFRLAAGDLLTLLCAVMFTIQILLIDRFSPGLDSIKLCTAQFTVAGAWSLLGMLLFEKPDFSAILSCALPLLYVAIFSSGVAYLLQIVSQREGDPAIVSLLFCLESVFSVIAGAILLHQRMTGREYLGCAILFLAVLIAQIPGFKRKNKGERYE